MKNTSFPAASLQISHVSFIGNVMHGFWTPSPKKWWVWGERGETNHGGKRKDLNCFIHKFMITYFYFQTRKLSSETSRPRSSLHSLSYSPLKLTRTTCGSLVWTAPDRICIRKLKYSTFVLLRVALLLKRNTLILNIPTKFNNNLFVTRVNLEHEKMKSTTVNLPYRPYFHGWIFPFPYFHGWITLEIRLLVTSKY